MRKAWVGLACLVMAIGACGEGKSSGADGDLSPGPAGCPAATGPNEVVRVKSDEGATVFTTVKGQAMNLDVVHGDPSPVRPFHTLAVGPCGRAALIWYDPVTEKTGRLMYQGIAPEPSAAEVVDGADPGRWIQASLFLDDACEPLVMAPETGGYAEFRRGAGGAWVRVPLPAPVESSIADLRPIAAWTATDRSMHLVARAQLDGIFRGLHGWRSPDVGASWTWTSFELPSSRDLSDLRVGPDGTVHALYTRTKYPCDPCNLDLYYGRLAPGGFWTEEVVQSSRWAAPDDAFATMGVLALTASGEPLVAATWQQRVVTGSLKSAELRLYGREGGTWCFETVADTVDGYQGRDGARMTGGGARPGRGRPGPGPSGLPGPGPVA